MDLAFSWVEDADWNIALDNVFEGVHSQSEPQQHGVGDLTVDIPGPIVAGGKDGERIYLSDTLANLDCSEDEFNVSTAVVNPGNSKILSLFIRFKRRLEDPRTDGNGQTVYTKQYEDAELFVRQGTEAVSPTPPAVLTDAILLGDVTLSFGQTQILNTDIDVTRAETWLRYVSPNFGTIAYGNARDVMLAALAIVDILWNAFPFSFTDTWYGGETVDGSAPPVTSIQEALDAIVYDLALATLDTGSAVRVGSNFIGTHGHQTPNTAITWGTATARSVQYVLEVIADAVDAHVFGAPPAHPASAITFSPYSYIAATDVQAAMQELIDDLAENSTTPDGAERIGFEPLTSGPPNYREYFGVGDTNARAAFLKLLALLDDKTGYDQKEDIQEDWLHHDKALMVKNLMGGGNAYELDMPDVAAVPQFKAGASETHMYIPNKTWFNWGGAQSFRDSAMVYIKPARPANHVWAMAFIDDVGLDVYFVDCRNPSIGGAVVRSIDPGGGEVPRAICSSGSRIYVVYNSDDVYAWDVDENLNVSLAWGGSPAVLPAGAVGLTPGIIMADASTLCTANDGIAGPNNYTLINAGTGAVIGSFSGSASPGATATGAICSARHPVTGAAIIYAVSDNAGSDELNEMDITGANPGYFGGANPTLGPGASWNHIACDGLYVYLPDQSSNGSMSRYGVANASAAPPAGGFEAAMWAFGVDYWLHDVVFDGIRVWYDVYNPAAAPLVRNTKLHGFDPTAIPTLGWGLGLPPEKLAYYFYPYAEIANPNEPGPLAFDGSSVWAIRLAGQDEITRLTNSHLR